MTDGKSDPPGYSDNRQTGYGVGYGTAAQPQPSSIAGFGERPMVFAFRQRPNIYVYEFGDRLEYYERTEFGMVWKCSAAKG